MAQGDYGRARDELGSALALAEKNGLEGARANSLCDLGFAELGGGRLDEARRRFDEALVVAARLVWTENIAYCLVGLAVVAADGGELARAGQLLGQADRLAQELNLELQVYARAARAQLHRDLLARLGEEELEALLADGRALSVEVAVSKALET
jgi:non-specific serine/threonine protein kinase